MDLIAWLLLVLCILSLVGRLIQLWGVYFNLSIVKAQQQEQEALQKQFEEQEEAEQSEYFSNLGTMGATAKQRKTLKGKFFDDMMDNPKTRVALSVLEQQFPGTYDYVMENKHLIPDLLEIMKEINNKSGSKVAEIPDLGFNGSSSKFM